MAYSSEDGTIPEQPPETRIDDQTAATPIIGMQSEIRSGDGASIELRRREPKAGQFNGRTTRFNTVDPKNVTNLTLEVAGKARIKWHHKKNIEGADLDRHITFGKGWVDVDSDALPQLSDDATITVFGLDYTTTPVVYQDGVLCTNCEIMNYANGELTFDVPHFTNYSTGPNTNLSIWDSAEGGSANVTETVTFYANYTNVSSGTFITGASCAISFDDGTSGSMTEGSSIYNATHSYGTNGTRTWNVTCSASGYETLNVSDTVVVNETFLVSSCRDLNTNGSYVLTQNISVNGSSCINIGANNVTVDCAGYALNGNNSIDSYGVYSTRINTTIKNCVITGFGSGIYFNNADNGTIENNSIITTTPASDVTSPFSSGVLLFNGASYNRLRNNIIHSQYGFNTYLHTNANYNEITNSTITSHSGRGLLIYYGYGNLISHTTVFSNTSYGLMITAGDNNEFTNVTLNSRDGQSIRITTAAENNTFVNCTSALSYSGVVQKVYSEAPQSTSSYGNLGWWPLIASNGSDATTQSMTAWYNGSSGGRYANGTANPNNKQWFGNKPEGCIGATQTFTCGEVVTESCTLNTNMTSDRTCLTIGSNNIAVDCAGYAIIGENIANSTGIYSARLNSTIKNCIINGFDNGIYYNTADNGLIENNVINVSTNNTASNPLSSAAILLYNNANNNRVINNSAFSRHGYAIHIYATSINNQIINTTGESQTSQGIRIYANAHNTQILNSRGSGNSRGIQIYYSENITVESSNGTSNEGIGIYLDAAMDSRINNSIGESNASYGIYLYGMVNGTIEHTRIESNSSYGAYLNAGSANNTFKNTTFSSRDSNSIRLTLSSANNLFINCTTSIDYNGTTQKFYADSTSGSNTSSYGNTGWWPLIASNGSDATTQSMTAWYNGTTGGRYANGTANPNNKQWFGNKPDGCIGATQTFTCGEVVTESCTLNANLTSDRTCFTIGANNVAIDCAEYSMTGNNSNTSIGIYSTKTNTTVRNCAINGFDSGIYFNGASNGTIENNTINTTTNYTTGLPYSSGILLFNNAKSNMVNNNNIHSQYGQGLIIWSSSNNIVSNCTSMTNQSYGLHLESSSNTTITDSNFTSDIGSGIYLYSGINNTIGDCTASSNTQRGIYIDASSYNKIENSFGISNTNDGIHLYVNSNHNQIINSTGQSITYTGLYIAGSFNNTLSNVRGISNAHEGIYLSANANNNQIINSNGTSNSSHGIRIDSSYNNSIINSAGTSNSNYGIYIYATSNTNISYSTASSNTSYGLRFTSQSMNNLITNSNFTSNSSYGMYISSLSSNNLFINCTNSIEYNGTTQKFLSDNTSWINTSSYGNTGWWPLIASNGADATTQSMTAWYNGSTGGRYANGTANPNNKQWFGNKPEGCIGATQTFTCGETVTESCTLNANLTSDRTCFTIGTDNIVIDGAGYTITGNLSSSARGVFSSNLNNITVKNLILREWEYSIFIQSGANSSIINNTINSSATLGQGINAGSIGGLVENNTIYLASNVALYPQGQNSVIRGNRVTGAAVYVTCGNCTITQNDFLGVELGHGAYNNTFANNTIRSITSNTDAIVATGNLFVNNTLTYTAGTIINMKLNSSGNIFCLNNFSATSGHYINDTNGSNSYNCTFDGLNQGNIYPNVLTSNVKVWGTNQTSITGLYAGVVGGGVPYSNSTSQGKIAGYAIDYAPLTYNRTTGCVGATRVFACGENITESCSMYDDVAVNGSTCFQINSSNVVMDCRGQSITGNLTTDTYGVYVTAGSEINNITIRNCDISRFYRPIFAYGGNNNCIIENNTISNFSDHGIAAYSQNYIIRDNIVNGTTSQGGISLFATNISAINNTLYNPLIGAINGARDCTIEHNTIYHGSIYVSGNYHNVPNNTYRNNIVYNATFGIWISNSNGSTFINNTIINGSVYIVNSYNHTFINNTNDVGYSGLTQKFTSNNSQNTASSGNIGWWPRLSSDGSDAGGQSNTSWYNGTSGGRNADGSANTSLWYWYNNQPAAYVNYSATTSVTASSVNIIWTTNLASNSSVAYGTTTALGATTGQNDAVTSHSVTLRYLSPLTTYYYNITSCTEICHTVGPYNFTTNGPPRLWNATITALTARNWSDESIYFDFNVTSNDSNGELAHYETMTSLKKNGQEQLLLALPFSQGDNSTFARNWRGANATVINATYNQTGGVDGTGGYEPDGNDFIYTTIPPQDYDAISWGGWYRFENYSNDGSYAMTFIGASGHNYYITSMNFYRTSEVITLSLYNGSWCTATPSYPVSLEMWHHLFFVYNTNRSIQTYVDGVEYTSLGNSCIIDRPLGLQYVYPGSYTPGAGQDSNGLNGSIDDFRVYNTSLTAEQIRAMYWEKKDVRNGLVGEWTFDKNSTMQEDTSTNNNTGTVSGAVFTSNGYGRGGYNLNGTGSIGISTDVTVPADAGSACAWFKTSQGNGSEAESRKTLLGRTTGGASRFNLNVDCRDATERVEVIIANSSNNGIYVYPSVNPTTCDGAWRHVCMVYAINTTPKIYYDGTETSYSLQQTFYESANQNLTLNMIGNGGFGAFNGTIDEVRLYNRSLNATEVGILYNRSYNKHMIADSMTSPGDTWSACYIASNYEATSNETCSGNITITNAYQLSLYNATISTLTTRNWSDENIYFDFNVSSTRRQLEEAAHYETLTSLQKNGREQLLVSLPMSYGDNSTFARNWRGTNATVINAIYNETGGVDGTGGYEFDGQYDYVQTSIPSQTYSTLSWGGWYNFKGGSTWVSTLGGPSTDYWLSAIPANEINLNVQFYNGSWCSATDYLPTGIGWHHIFVVYEQHKNVRAYIDGREYISSGYQCAIDKPLSVANVFPGSYVVGSYSFNGSVDDFRIYNTSLTAEQVRAMYWEKKDVRNGLVGEWTFDKNSTTYEDTSINNMDLNMSIPGTGFTWTPQGYGQGAVSFNGNDSSIASQRGNITIPGSNFSLSIWFYSIKNATSSQRDTEIMGSSSGLRLYQHNSNDKIYFYDDGSQFIDWTVAMNQWHHVVCSVTLNVSTCWADGVQRTMMQSTDIFNDISDIYVGYRFNGTIDEVRLYNRSLNATEVSILYNRSYDKHMIADSMTSPGDTWSACYVSAAGTNTSSEVCSGNITLPNAYQLTLNGATLASIFGDNRSNESAYFTFNVTSTRRESEEAAHYETLTSLTKNGEEQLILAMPFSYGDNSTFARNWRGANGTAYGRPTYNATGGIDGTGAYEFDGIDDIVTANIDINTQLENQTVSMWLKATQSSAGGLNNVFARTQGNNGYWAYISNNLRYGSGFCINHPLGINETEWHHFVTTATNGTIYAYIDGVLIKNVSTNETNCNFTGVSALSIGRYSTSSSIGFNGSIDDVKLFNTSLSADQIRQLYWEKKDVHNGLVAEWTFDSNATKGEDTSKNNNTLNTSVTATWIPQGYARGAYSIAPADTAPYAKNSRELNPGLNDWTVSTWFYSDSLFPYNGSRNDYNIFRKAQDLNNTFYIRLRNSNIVQFYRSINGSQYSASSSPNISPGAWHHLVFTFNRSNDRLLTYVDTNYAIGAELMNLSGIDMTNTGEFYIGQWAEGKIDEFRIYNRTLSDAEISLLYNRSYEKHALTANQTKEGDTWSACYVSTAGTNTSSEVCSNSIYFPDYTAPSITATPANNTYYNASALNLSAMLADEGGLQNTSLAVRNSTGATVYSNSTTYTGRNQTADVTRNITLPDNAYTHIWTIYDNANRSTTINYTFTIDTTAPNITVNEPANDSPVRSEFAINTTIIERNLKNMTYTWNGTGRTLYDDSIIIMYNFENNSVIGENNTIMKDASQYGNDASCTNCPVWNESGRHGGAYGFNTTTYINTGNNTPDLYRSDFTMSVWVYEYAPKYRATIIGQKQDSGSSLTTGWSLVSDDGYFSLYFANGTNFSRANHGLIHSNNTWYHVVAVWNSTNRTPTIYVNGVRGIGTVATQNFTYVNIPYNLGIGSSNGDGATSTFNGSIDEVRVYNRSLSAAEVELLHRSNLRKYTNDSWKLVINQTNVSVNTEYDWSITASDRADNTGTTGTYTVEGSSGPIIASMTNNPASWDDLDPDTIIIVNTTITDPQGDYDTILLQWKNATSDWNNAIMLNTTPHASSTMFIGNFTAGAEGNFTYRIWANDSTGINGTSTSTTIPIFWDCTWQLSETYLGESVGYDEIKPIGNITIENTGDTQYANNNCTLGMRLTYDLNEGRVYFDGSYIKPSDTYTILAKTNSTIRLNASFLAEIREETPVITVNDLYGRSNLSQLNASATLISTTGGPYLYQRISNAPISVELTPQDISIEAYLRNIMGNGDLNTTAFNVTATWDLPAGSSLSGGNTTSQYQNISDNVERALDINLTFDSSNLQGWTPGTQQYALSVIGYHENGTPIQHSDNRTTLTETTDIVFVCYPTSDGVQVRACGTLDPDNTEETTPPSGGGGGGGGGRGGGGATLDLTPEESTRIFNTTSHYELVRGEGDSFIITMENPFPDELIGVRINVTGLLSTYLRIEPAYIPALPPGQKVNYTVIITAPGYFDEAEHALRFFISGTLFRQEQRGETTITTISHMVEERQVTLKVLEITPERAGELLIRAEAILAQISTSAFNSAQTETDMEALRQAYTEGRYGLLNEILGRMEQRLAQAVQTDKKIRDLGGRIEWAKERRVSTVQSERAVYLAQTAFERGDYALALERIKEAELIYATEVKGEIPIRYYYETYKRQIWTVIALCLLFSIGAAYASKRALLNHRIKESHKEEAVILGLIKQAQHECFENKSMSLEEYNETIQQYEQRLAHTITMQISDETKRQHMLSFEPKHSRLEKEREKIMERVKELQHQYISLGGVETRVYEQRMKSLTERVAEIDEERAMEIANRALRKARFRKVEP